MAPTKYPARFRRLRLVGLGLLAVMLGACSDGDDKPSGCETLSDGSCVGVTEARICDKSFCPAAELSCQRSLYVDRTSQGGDGSEVKPFGALSEAAAVAVAGDCILLAPGEYEGATLKSGVSLLGAGAASVTIRSRGPAALSVGPGQGASLTSLMRGFSVTGDGRGIAVDSTEGLTITQVRLEKLQGVALSLRASHAQLSFIEIVDVGAEQAAPTPSDSGAPADAGTPTDSAPAVDAGVDAAPGPDAAASDGTADALSADDAGANDLPPAPDLRLPPDLGQLDLAATPDASTAPQAQFGVGLLVAAGSDVQASRLLISGCAAQGAIASASKLTLSDSLIRENAVYGLAVDCGGESCSRDQSEARIERCELVQNGGVGLWGRRSRLTVVESRVDRTRRLAGAELARGIEVVSCELTLRESEIVDSEAQGLVMHESGGLLADNTISGSLERGVWLQHIAEPLRLEANRIEANRRIGLGLFDAKQVVIDGGLVRTTENLTSLDHIGETVTIGDGIDVLAGSQLEIRSVEIINNDRVGLLIDDASANVQSAVIESASSGETEALVVQNATLSQQVLGDIRNAQGSKISPVVPQKAFAVIRDPAVIQDSPLPIP